MLPRHGLVIAEARNLDRPRLIVKRNTRMKGMQITDVKTSLFLLSELFWIKGDDDMPVDLRTPSASAL